MFLGSLVNHPVWKSVSRTDYTDFMYRIYHAKETALHCRTLIADLVAHDVLPFNQEVWEQLFSIRSQCPFEMVRPEPSQILDKWCFFAAKLTGSCCEMSTTRSFMPQTFQRIESL